MKDLEQLEKKNQNILNSNKNAANNSHANRRKFGAVPSTGQKKNGVNYEDRIKELQAKLFGK